MPFEARVKSVLSGDTVVLSHVTNPTQERILSLAYVSAPRLRREGDEVGLYLDFIAVLLGQLARLLQFSASRRAVHRRRAIEPKELMQGN